MTTITFDDGSERSRDFSSSVGSSYHITNERQFEATRHSLSSKIRSKYEKITPMDRDTEVVLTDHFQ